MIILIDGYNALKKIYGKDASLYDRKSMIYRLIMYARKKSHLLKIVFDGGSSGFVTKETIDHIEIWESGYKHSADEVIIEFVYGNQEKEILVVTEDRDIAHKVTKGNVQVITPYVFFNAIDDVMVRDHIENPLVKNNTSCIVKMTDHIDHDLDALMEATKNNNIKNDYLEEYILKKKILSKKEKKIEKKIKKL